MDDSTRQLLHYLKAPLVKEPMIGKVVSQSLNSYIQDLGECLKRNRHKFKVFPLDPLGEIIDFIYQPLCTILANPRYVYEKKSFDKPSYKVKQVDMGNMLRIFEKSPGRTVAEKIRHSRILPALESVKNFNRTENRAVKYFINKLFPLLEKRIHSLDTFGDNIVKNEIAHLNHLKKLYLKSPVKNLTINRALEINNVLLFDKNYSRIWMALKRLEGLERYQKELSDKKNGLWRQLLLYRLLDKLSNGNCYWLERVIGPGKKDPFMLKDLDHFEVVCCGELIKIYCNEKGIEIKRKGLVKLFKVDFPGTGDVVQELGKYINSILKQFFPGFRNNYPKSIPGKSDLSGSIIGIVPYSLDPLYTIFKHDSPVKKDTLPHQMLYEKDSITLYPQLPYLIENPLNQDDRSQVLATNWIDVFNKNDDTSEPGNSGKVSVDFITPFADLVEEQNTIVFVRPDGINTNIIKSITEISLRFFTGIKSISHSVAAVLWYGKTYEKSVVSNKKKISVVDFLSPVPTVTEFVPVSNTGPNQPLFWKRVLSRPLEENDEEDDRESIPGIIDVYGEISREVRKVHTLLRTRTELTGRKISILEKHKQSLDQYHKYNKGDIIIISDDPGTTVSISPAIHIPNITRKRLLEGLEEFIDRENKNLISYEELYPEVTVLCYNSCSKGFDMIKNEKGGTFKPEWGKKYKIIEKHISCVNKENIYLPIYVKNTGARWQEHMMGIIPVNEDDGNSGTLTVYYLLGEVNPYKFIYTSSSGKEKEIRMYDNVNDVFKIDYQQPYLHQNQSMNRFDYSSLTFEELLERYCIHKGHYNGEYFNTENNLVSLLTENSSLFLSWFQGAYKQKDFKTYYKLLHLLTLSLMYQTDDTLKIIKEQQEDDFKSLVKHIFISLIFPPNHMERLINEKDEALDNKLKNRLKGMLDNLILLLGILSIDDYPIPLTKKQKAELVFALIKCDSLLKSQKFSLLSGKRHHEVYWNYLSLKVTDQTDIDSVILKVLNVFGCGDLYQKMITS